MALPLGVDAPQPPNGRGLGDDEAHPESRTIPFPAPVSGPHLSSACRAGKGEPAVLFDNRPTDGPERISRPMDHQRSLAHMHLDIGLAAHTRTVRDAGSCHARQAFETTAGMSESFLDQQLAG